MSNKSVSTKIDPNFFLPPNIVDATYRNVDEDVDTAIDRNDSGEIVNVDYDEVGTIEFGEGEENAFSNSQTSLLPPNSVSFVSQQVRITSDGKAVVDVILEVDDIPGVINYDVRLTK